MNVLKLMKLMVLLPFLAACNGSDSTQSTEPLTDAETTLADLVGVWDASDGDDLYYLSIDEDGLLSFVDYNYYDSQQVACFEVNATIQLADLGGGLFELSDDGEYGTMIISVADAQMTFIEEETGDSISYPAADLSLSDLTPLCEEVLELQSVEKQLFQGNSYPLDSFQGKPYFLQLAL